MLIFNIQAKNLTKSLTKSFTDLCETKRLKI